VCLFIVQWLSEKWTIFRFAACDFSKCSKQMINIYWYDTVRRSRLKKKIYWNLISDLRLRYCLLCENNLWRPRSRVQEFRKKKRNSKTLCSSLYCITFGVRSGNESRETKIFTCRRILNSSGRARFSCEIKHQNNDVCYKKKKKKKPLSLRPGTRFENGTFLRVGSVRVLDEFYCSKNICCGRFSMSNSFSNWTINYIKITSIRITSV